MTINPQNPVILCVDDDAANLKLLEKLLVPRGYEVVGAVTGKDALLKIRSRAIDLVLLDVMMPGMDGFEVCRQIKEDQKLRSIPVILITALTARQDRIRGIEAGAEEFLSKPFDQTEALARIKILLKVKELGDERQRAESQKEAAFKALQKSNVELDRLVRERTAELAQANEILQADILERKRTEENLMNSLAEKEMLLKEVHHRVKNNLMTIIGLIKMQESKASNELFNPLLQELESRIRAMALVHESLHKSDSLAHIDLQDYIETLSAQIHARFGVDLDVRLRVQASGVDVNLEIAVPIGLILNEMITNAYKHAFPGGKTHSRAGSCEIAVTVKNEDGILTISVADNGVGLPKDLMWEKSDSLGLKLIKMLSTQLNGSIELERNHGTTFQLRFAHAAATGCDEPRRI